MKGEVFEGEGIGSASSHVTRKDGTRVVRMRDVGLRHNATLKMAQKSAYIAATLNATAASEFFTQDMEEGEDSRSDIESPKSTHPGPVSPDKIGVCPIHKKPFREGKSGGYCSTKMPDGTWCKEKPRAVVEGEVVPDLSARPDRAGGPDTFPDKSGPVEMTWGEFFSWACRPRDQNGLGYGSRDKVAQALGFRNVDELQQSGKPIADCVAALKALRGE